MQPKYSHPLQTGGACAWVRAASPRPNPRARQQQIDFWTNVLRNERPGVKEAFRRAGLDVDRLVVADFDTEDYLVVTPELRVLEIGYGFVDGLPGFDIEDDERLANLPLLIHDYTETWESHPHHEHIAAAYRVATVKRAE